MKRTHAYSIGLLVVALWAGGCGKDARPSDSALMIELRWIRGFAQEDPSDIETGLLWTLSFLGASLPRDTSDLLSWRDHFITLRLDRAGIAPEARPHWERLLAAMRASEEYRLMGALDVGRFVALTLCSPWHYYALTGASLDYDEARAKYSFDPRSIAIVESGVAHGNRLLEVAQGPALRDLAFIAHEGTGSIRDRTFQTQEHELLGVMPNGQLRFALYGTNGTLKSAASSSLTAAGKPSKCLWCHETHLLRPFNASSDVEGYYSWRELEQRVATRMERLRIARGALDSRIEFLREQDHTFAELLYLAFYEPSAERIAREWNVPLEQAQQALSELPTHAHREFRFLGAQLYRRSDVDALAPYGVIGVPTDPREASEYEPNLLK